MQLTGIAEASFPWEILGGGSAVLAVIWVVVFMQKNASDTLKTVSADFAATVKATASDATQKNQQNVEVFSKTASDLSEVNATLVREARAAHEKCEETIHNLLKDQLVPRSSRRTDPT